MEVTAATTPKGFVFFAYNDLPRHMKTAIISEWMEKFGYLSRTAIVKKMERKNLSIGETDLVIKFLHKNDLLESMLSVFKAQTEPVTV